MGMNKVKLGSNMYPFLNDMSGGRGYTWNPIRGKCSHSCSYCFVPKVTRGKQGDLRLDEKEFKTDLGEGNFIFVGSSTDMWAEDVPWKWIERVETHCEMYPKNTYLFQSKNPGNFNFVHFPVIYGTTIETNRLNYGLSKAPSVYSRARALMNLSGNKQPGNKQRTMVTIEPIVDFGLDAMVEIIEQCNPEWVNIGADSCGHKLPEPSSEKIGELIAALRGFTEVKLKKNLSRIYKGE